MERACGLLVSGSARRKWHARAVALDCGQPACRTSLPRRSGAGKLTRFRHGRMMIVSLLEALYSEFRPAVHARKCAASPSYWCMHSHKLQQHLLYHDIHKALMKQKIYKIQSIVVLRLLQRKRGGGDMLYVSIRVTVGQCNNVSRKATRCIDGAIRSPRAWHRSGMRSWELVVTMLT